MEQVSVVKIAGEKLGAQGSSQKVIVGFDGFIDEIIHVVKERVSDTEHTRIETIPEFAAKIGAAAGLSANVEFIPLETKLGGNGPIMANALGAQGHVPSYIGALGNGAINPIFNDFVAKCDKVITLADPGHTDALEFNDGKLMLSKMETLLNINMEMLLETTPREELVAMVKEAKLLAFTNWTEIPEFNSLVVGFTDIIREAGTRPGVFIDLADPAKRNDEDIMGICELLSNLEEVADVLYGLNENESAQIANVYGIDEADFTKRAEAIRDAMDISAVVIHPIAGAAYANREGSDWIDGPYTKTPKLTTGAGDNFNSGFCNAWLAGLSGEESIAVGVCTSGFYVRECHSPSREELLDFMARWSGVKCGDI